MEWEALLGRTRSYCPHMGASLANACTHDATRRSVCADRLSADCRVLIGAAKRGQRRKEESVVAGRKCGEWHHQARHGNVCQILALGSLRPCGARRERRHINSTTPRPHDSTPPQKSPTHQTRSVSWRGGNCSRVWNLEFGTFSEEEG
jgi:hypothetical protein